MGEKPRISILTLDQTSRLQRQWTQQHRDIQHLICHGCKKKIALGSRIVRMHYQGHDKYYHLRCYRQ